jgi:hypothetical protein
MTYILDTVHTEHDFTTRLNLGQHSRCCRLVGFWVINGDNLLKSMGVMYLLKMLITYYCKQVRILRSIIIFNILFSFSFLLIIRYKLYAYFIYSAIIFILYRVIHCYKNEQGPHRSYLRAVSSEPLV